MRRDHVPFLLLAGLIFVACNQGGGRADDEVLLVGLSEARAWQRRADLHLQGGDIPAAIADVREALKVPFPVGAQEAEDARLDARARLAQLSLRGAPGTAEGEEQALAELQAAQREVTRDSFFRANLESVLAEVYEARAKRLTDPAEQKATRKLALAALERAIQIDKRLQRAFLGSRETGK